MLSNPFKGLLFDILQQGVGVFVSHAPDEQASMWLIGGVIEQEVEQFEAGFIGPVEVIEKDHDGATFF